MCVTAHFERPTREHARAARRSRDCRLPYLVLLRVGFTMPPMLPPARCALTAPFHPYRCAETTQLGGLFSVALSVGSRLPGVTWHPALWSPDFPPLRHEDEGATVRPTPKGHSNTKRARKYGVLSRVDGWNGYSCRAAAFRNPRFCAPTHKPMSENFSTVGQVSALRHLQPEAIKLIALAAGDTGGETRSLFHRQLV